MIRLASFSSSRFYSKRCASHKDAIMLGRLVMPSAIRSGALAVRPLPKLAVRHISPIAARLLSTETKQEIDKAVSSAPVVLFMKGTPDTPQCGYSGTIIQLLSMQGVDPAKFAAFNVLEDEALRQGIKEYSDWPTIPQLYVNQEFVGGCDILLNMYETGELTKMLEEKKVLLLEEDEGKTES